MNADGGAQRPHIVLEDVDSPDGFVTYYVDSPDGERLARDALRVAGFAYAYVWENDPAADPDSADAFITHRILWSSPPQVAHVIR